MKLTEKQKQEIRRLVADISPGEEFEIKATFMRAAKRAAERGADTGLLDAVKTLWKMLVDSDYTIRWETKAWIIAGLTYFVSPLDAIPDPIAGVGYLDDALVVAWVLHRISDEVVRYRELRRVA